MKGTIRLRPDGKAYRVEWFHGGKLYKLSRYKGAILHKTHPDPRRCMGYQNAQKLLSQMQGDLENGTFRIEKYTGHGWTDTICYLEEWLEAVKGELTPAGYKDYANSIKNHLIPFFKANPFQLHEIQYDVLRMLLNWIKREGKGKQNVMGCLHACLTYAWRSQRIPEMPAFPERRLYGITEPVIEWIPEERQMAIIAEIPEADRPIFLFLKYHLRRPAEACALQWDDWDQEEGSFLIRRSVSARKLIDRTKTRAEHLIPCHTEFMPVMEALAKAPNRLENSFVFKNPRARKEGRYTDESLGVLWRNACKRAGETIGLYAGLKHSSCSQFVNEKNMSLAEVQVVTDHASAASVRRYAKVELARKRELMERKIIKIEDIKKEAK